MRILFNSAFNDHNVYSEAEGNYRIKEFLGNFKDTDYNGEAYISLVHSEEYIEIDMNKDVGKKAKIVVRPFVLKQFEDVNSILEILREGYTIALINIGPLKSDDVIELKRAINKLKKTCDAIGGDIAAFGENWIAVTPAFAMIHRKSQAAPMRPSNDSDDNSQGPAPKIETY